jgi:hypothetical protein
MCLYCRQAVRTVLHVTPHVPVLQATNQQYKTCAVPHTYRLASSACLLLCVGIFTACQQPKRALCCWSAAVHNSSNKEKGACTTQAHTPSNTTCRPISCTRVHDQCTTVNQPCQKTQPNTKGKERAELPEPASHNKLQACWTLCTAFSAIQLKTTAADTLLCCKKPLRADTVAGLPCSMHPTAALPCTSKQQLTHCRCCLHVHIKQPLAAACVDARNDQLQLLYRLRKP